MMTIQPENAKHRGRYAPRMEWGAIARVVDIERPSLLDPQTIMKIIKEEKLNQIIFRNSELTE